MLLAFYFFIHVSLLANPCPNVRSGIWHLPSFVPGVLATLKSEVSCNPVCSLTKLFQSSTQRWTFLLHTIPRLFLWQSVQTFRFECTTIPADYYQEIMSACVIARTPFHSRVRSRSSKTKNLSQIWIPAGISSWGSSKQFRVCWLDPPFVYVGNRQQERNDFSNSFSRRRCNILGHHGRTLPWYQKIK